MCFSASASFGSAAVLMSLGSSASKLNHDPKQRMFVALPFIFGFQQLCEGFVWISIGQNSTLNSIAVRAFLFFALAFWPGWLPWCLYAMEKKPERKSVLKVLGFMGLLFSLGAVWILYRGGPRAAVSGNSIAYSFSGFQSFLSPSVDALVYLLTALVPFFISTERKVKITGALVFIGLIISHIYQQEAVASVWCFFAALTSTYIVYEVFRETKAPKRRFYLQSHST